MKIIVAIFLTSFIINSHAKIEIERSTNIKCKLPKTEKLVIGCTSRCGKFTTWGLRWHAKKLGYKLKIINLLSRNQTIDHTQVDGILIPGGDDIDPKWYISKVTQEFANYLEGIKHWAKLTSGGAKRDTFEFGLLEEYFQNPKQKYQPILGICRGMQVLTVSQGIPLYVDLKKEIGIKNRRYKIDTIKGTNPESLLHEIIGRKKFKGVELHHQALNLDYFAEHRSNWPHIEVTALSNKNNVAESLEFYKRPILGVQFHPEYTFGRVRKNIFRWLLKRACFNKIMGSKLNRGSK